MIPTESDASSLTIKVAFLDVGQGDTIVISCPETREAFVVDCIDADAVLDYLQQEQIQFLRSIIVTHLHADHYSNVADLLANYALVPDLQACEVLAFNEFLNQKDFEKLLSEKLPLAQIFEDSDMHSSNVETPLSRKTHLEDLRRWADQNKLKCSSLQVSASPWPFKGFMTNTTQILHPYFRDYPKLEVRGLNNTSIVIRIVGLGTSALLTGDLEPAGWRFLLENHPDVYKDILKCDVLKFPHHGGAWSALDTESLLNTVQPSVVIFSVGTNGAKYGHPNRAVFEVLSSSTYSHIQVLCTQATNQCYGSATNYRSSVVQHLDRAARDKGQERIGSKNGCPCAGTVVVELGKQVSIVQPSQIFHRDSIIRPYFSAHKCTFL